MTWGQLVRKNVLRRKRLYVGYIASSSIAVMTLFMFMNFTYNPAVEHGYMTSGARDILLISGWLVALFALFFIFYFHAAMLRLRGQEFGILLVVGITPKQLARMVRMESFIVDGISLVFGLGLGLLFTKLFLLAIGDLLKLPNEIPFAAPRNAWIFTLVAFLIIFLAEALLMSIRLRRSGVKRLLSSERSRQKPPKASGWLALLGVFCIAGGYYLAIAKSLITLSSLIGVIFIIALVILGTYLLFTQILVWVLLRLRHRVQGGVGLLVVSRLAYRMKDNARALTVIATLSAIVMTSMSSIFGLLYANTQADVAREPFAVMTWTNKANPLPLSQSQITQKLSASGADPRGQAAATVIGGGKISVVNHGRSEKMDVTVVSASAFAQFSNQIRSAHQKIASTYTRLPDLNPGHAIGVISFPITATNIFHDTKTTLTIGSTHTAITVDAQRNQRIFNFAEAPVSDTVLVVPDTDFSHLLKSVSQTDIWQVHGWIVDHRDKAAMALHGQLPTRQADVAQGNDQAFIRLMSVMIFAGLFLAMLMLLACGNTLYFRLLNNQMTDRKQFRSLRRVGIRHREVGRVLTVEFSVLFFLPFVMAGLHTAAAIIDYSHVLALPGSLWPVCLAVMLAYLVFMVIYFIVARLTYLPQLHMDEAYRVE
ncbi:FtsX-like permease family protein [Alicyclobacillus fodiniaquatilis]|uniref:FtsX-like permease family protein n=1 Tax=Alicyclobacillus fodiniaquatilis TaxID=1661150 RepID=A0ABW4JGK4_9BACL